MKKLLAVTIAAVMMTGLLAGCGAGETAAQDTTTEAPEETTAQENADAAQENADAAQEDSEQADASAEGRTFTVGFDAEFPPYGYMDENGEYTGFDLELAAEVCSRNGWTLVKQPIDWDAKDMELSSGSIDCIWNGFTMNGREDQYTFCG